MSYFEPVAVLPKCLLIIVAVYCIVKIMSSIFLIKKDLQFDIHKKPGQTTSLASYIIIVLCMLRIPILDRFLIVLSSLRTFQAENSYVLK